MTDASFRSQSGTWAGLGVHALVCSCLLSWVYYSHQPSISKRSNGRSGRYHGNESDVWRIMRGTLRPYRYVQLDLTSATTGRPLAIDKKQGRQGLSNSPSNNAAQPQARSLGAG